MHIETLNLSENGKYKCTYYIQDESPEINISHKRPMVVVCPGGAYYFTSDREAEPIAMSYVAAGFNAAVVRYPVNEDAGWPAPQAAVSKSLKYVRDNAEKFLTDPGKIALCGFSAGGHLVASMGVHWDDKEICELSECSKGENRPDALILGYPVISTKENSIDTETFGYLLQNYRGTPEFERILEYVSCENYVSDKTPPVFIFSTFTDNAVPIMNSILFSESCARNNVSCEMHIFAEGWHGLALSDLKTASIPQNINKDCAQWMQLSINWLNNLFGTDPLRFQA